MPMKQPTKGANQYLCILDCKFVETMHVDLDIISSIEVNEFMKTVKNIVVEFMGRAHIKNMRFYKDK
jgi:hypothetical protein